MCTVTMVASHFAVLILACLCNSAQLNSGQSSSSGGGVASTSSTSSRGHEFLSPSGTPEARGTTVSFTIDEELPIGSRIGSLIERLGGAGQYSMRHPLLEETMAAASGSVNFIPLTDERLVLLNRTSGLLTVRQRIDREALCRDLSICCPGAPEALSPADGSFLPTDLDAAGSDAFLNPRLASCALKMLVMDQRPRADASHQYPGGPSPSPASAPTQDQNSLIHVFIYVNDLNDNAPYWSPNKLELEIPEHTAIGRMFQLPEATDPDQGPEHTVQHYQLVATDGPPGKDRYVGAGAGVSVFDASGRQTASSTSDMFSLSHEISERLTTSPYKFNLRLKVNADLDREKQATYYFLLYAIDGGGPRVSYHDSSSLVQQAARQLTGTLTIVVKVTDINDQAPYFLRPQPSIEILENTPVGTQIYTIAANDNDPSDANRLVYRIGSAASTEVTRLFSINAQTGAAFVIGEIDYETAPYLPSRESSDKLSGGHMMSQGYGHTAKKEVGYLIPVEVSDGAHIAETELRVQIINVNDNAPNISIQSHLQRSSTTGEIPIKEDVPEGTLVATISMTDADERGPAPSNVGSQGMVSYLHESPYREALPHCSTTNPFFLIQPLFPGARNHFKLVTARRLDHEIKANLGVTVMCHDSGQPVLSSKQHINVRLEDVNDSPPVFDKSVYYARISEGLPIHTPITQVHATDADTRLFADLRYRLVSPSPPAGGGSPGDRQVLESAILLDERTGQVRSGAVFDRELMSSINFTVLAVDCAGGPDWRNNSVESGTATACSQVNTATAEVIVLIEDANDCAPEFDQQSYEFSIAEGQPPKTLVGRVHAMDRDADAKNSRVRYSINDNSGDEGVRVSRIFSITYAGEIFTGSMPIDRETMPIITFSVAATDYGDPPLSAFATVVIRVEDINDNAPQWIFPPPSKHSVAHVNISLFSTVGLVVAHLRAVDPDISAAGQVEYEILRGNQQGYFALDKTSGTLYLAKLLTLNYNEKPKPSGTTPTIGQNEGGQSSSDNEVVVSPPTLFTLSLKASDNGEPQRSNMSLLRIYVQSDDGFVNPLPLGPGASSGGAYGEGLGVAGRQQKEFTSRGNAAGIAGGRRILDRDWLIMIVMIIITLLVSVLLIMAIVFLRCRQTVGDRSSGSGSEAQNASLMETRLAHAKPPSAPAQSWWLSRFSHDPPGGQARLGTATLDKSGFTLESAKRSDSLYLHGSQSHYGSATGQFIPDTLKSLDGTYNRISPAVLVSQTMATLQGGEHGPQHHHHQREDGCPEGCTDSPPPAKFAGRSSVGACLVPTTDELTPQLFRIASTRGAPAYPLDGSGGSGNFVSAVASCATTSSNSTTLPNNRPGIGIAHPQRCYMTINPDLYAVQYPAYGQLKYAGWNLLAGPARRASSPSRGEACFDSAEAQYLLAENNSPTGGGGCGGGSGGHGGGGGGASVGVDDDDDDRHPSPSNKPGASGAKQADRTGGPPGEGGKQHEPKRCRFKTMPNVIDLVDRDSPQPPLYNSRSREDLSDATTIHDATHSRKATDSSDPLSSDTLIFDIQ